MEPKSNSAITRRWALESDRDFARNVHHRSYRDVVERQYGPWDEKQQDEFFEASWKCRSHEIIYSGESLCGYCAVELNPEFIYIHELVILPEFQGIGIGTNIISELIVEAKEKKIPLRLQTHMKNQAQVLYRRLGFKEMASTDTHIKFEYNKMDTPDEEIMNRALEFARTHKKEIASRLTDVKLFPPDEIPISVFMAGSPGAGKTESARNLIARFSADMNILHIDVDELRKEFAEYTGTNSSLFQGATSIIADRMHDSALDQKQSFVFDGTLTNMIRARENIVRSLKRNRAVFIVYVYQDPLQAWKFVAARKLKDGRMVPIDAFVRQYFEARENVNQLKREFGEKVQVDVIVKNLDGTDFGYFENTDVIDRHLPEKYSKDTLQAILQASI